MGTIGRCEFCGRESDAASDSAIICTRCRGIIENELWQLEPNEPARKAYEHARQLCRLRGKIDALREEIEKLRGELAAYKKIKED